MRRVCQEIHPIPIPASCPICAEFIRFQNLGPGRKPAEKSLFDLIGEGEEKPKSRCQTPDGADETTFLEEPEQINICDAGSGSGGSGGECVSNSMGCGVAAVYCQGNVLMVVYTSPFVFPKTTTTTEGPTTTTTGAFNP